MAGPRLTLFILVILSALSQVDRGVLSLLVDPISRSLGVNDFQISLLQGAAFALFYAAFGLPFGAIADRWSRRWLIFGGVFVWSLAATACGLATTFNQLALARFLLGAGEAALYPAALSLISDIFPRQRLAGAIAVFTIGTSIGGGLSLGLSGYLLEAMSAISLSLPVIGSVQPWQAVFIVTGAPGVLLAFLTLLLPEPRRGQVRAASATWAAFFAFIWSRGAFFLRHFAGFTLLGILAIGVAAWIPALLMRRFGFSPREAGVSYGAIAAGATVLGMLAAGFVLDRMIRRGISDAPLRLYVWATPVVAVFAIVGCLSASAALFLACICVAQFALSMAGPAATAIQLVSPPPMRGRASALFALVCNLIGITLGPGLVGWLTTYVFHDPRAVHLSLAALFAVIAPLAWLIFLSGLRPMRDAMAMADVTPSAN